MWNPCALGENATTIQCHKHLVNLGPCILKDFLGVVRFSGRPWLCHEHLVIIESCALKEIQGVTHFPGRPCS